jgi:hypothetical protein
MIVLVLHTPRVSNDNFQIGNEVFGATLLLL